jgi:hypothetical protein
MDKKQNKSLMIAGVVVAVILISGTSFFAGAKFGGKGGRGNFAGRGQFGDGQMMQRGGATGVPGQGNQKSRLNFIDGELLSSGAGTMTIKLTDGGSKIILVSSSTQVMKTTAGAISDLQVGNRLMVNGDTNSDGSVTAKTIQLRDAALMANPGQPQVPAQPQQ